MHPSRFASSPPNEQTIPLADALHSTESEQGPAAENPLLALQVQDKD
jgi:hypothetical protein